MRTEVLEGRTRAESSLKESKCLACKGKPISVRRSRQLGLEWSLTRVLLAPLGPLPAQAGVAVKPRGR